MPIINAFLRAVLMSLYSSYA